MDRLECEIVVSYFGKNGIEQHIATDSLLEAREYAQKRIGKHPYLDILGGYAIDRNASGKITSNLSLERLFPL
jgi:hypothetical protein